MANGIELRQLRREIRRETVVATPDEVQEIWNKSEAHKISLWKLDTKYLYLPRFTYNKVLQHLGIGNFSYESDRRDCDDFSFATRGSIPLEFEINGVAAVLDGSGEHAYNAFVCREEGEIDIFFLEPQADTSETWWVKNPGDIGMYDMEHGLALL